MSRAGARDASFLAAAGLAAPDGSAAAPRVGLAAAPAAGRACPPRRSTVKEGVERGGGASTAGGCGDALGAPAWLPSPDANARCLRTGGCKAAPCDTLPPCLPHEHTRLLLPGMPVAVRERHPAIYLWQWAAGWLVHLGLLLSVQCACHWRFCGGCTSSSCRPRPSAVGGGPPRSEDRACGVRGSPSATPLLGRRAACRGANCDAGPD